MFNDLGYSDTIQLLNSADFGVPQSRPRVFLVFTRKLEKSISLSPGNGKRKVFRDIITRNDCSIPVSQKWQKYIDLYTGAITANDIPFPLPKTRRSLERIDNDADLNDCVFQIRSSGIRALSIDKPLPTLAVSISGGGAMIPVYSKERRHLSLLELKRLMGFPDSFKFPVARTSAIKQLANAVCPPVVLSVGKDILEQIPLSDSLFTPTYSSSTSGDRIYPPLLVQ